MKMRSVPSLKSFVGRPRAATSCSHEALVGGMFVPLATPPTKAKVPTNSLYGIRSG